jgi:hypothetical protein
MKKTLIALALMSMAGTASAKSVQVQADVFSGREYVKSFTAVVEDGKPIEIQDKELLGHFGRAPVVTEAGKHPATLTNEAQTPEPGFTLKMTPLVLGDGQVLLDAAYSLTTLEAKMVLSDGVEKEEPVTHIRSIQTQVLVDKYKTIPPDQLSIKSGELIVTFSAIEI